MHGIPRWWACSCLAGQFLVLRQGRHSAKPLGDVWSETEVDMGRRAELQVHSLLVAHHEHMYLVLSLREIHCQIH